MQHARAADARHRAAQPLDDARYALTFARPRVPWLERREYRGDVGSGPLERKAGDREHPQKLGLLAQHPLDLPHDP